MVRLRNADGDRVGVCGVHFPGNRQYADGDSFHGPGGCAGPAVEGALIHAHKYNGNPIGLQLPMFVELEVAETELGVRGDTASGSGTKIAKLETGLEIRVPLFIKQGENSHRNPRVFGPGVRWLSLFALGIVEYAQ
jgi:hypothetical protein